MTMFLVEEGGAARKGGRAEDYEDFSSDDW